MALLTIRCAWGDIHQGEFVGLCDREQLPIIQKANGVTLRGDYITEPTAHSWNGEWWTVAFPDGQVIRSVPASDAQEAIEHAKLAPEYRQ